MGCCADGESRRHAFLRRVLPFSSSSSSLKNSSVGRLFPLEVFSDYILLVEMHLFDNSTEIDTGFSNGEMSTIGGLL